MRAAYDALDERTKAEIEPLVCLHSLIYSREAIGFTALGDDEMAAFRPVRQRLVRTHPGHRRANRCFSPRMPGPIEELDDPRGRGCSCADLTEHATQREFVPFARVAAMHDLVHVGQSPDDAPRPPLRRPQRGARRPPHRLSPAM